MSKMSNDNGYATNERERETEAAHAQLLAADARIDGQKDEPQQPDSEDPSDHEISS